MVALFSAGCGSDEADAPASSTSSREVVGEFRKAGLEVGKATKMTREDFGLAPLKTDDATRFLIPSLGTDSGGRAFVFEDTDSLKATKAYYDKLGEGSAAFFSHTFANEDAGALVQINGELPDNRAKAYERVIDQLE